MTNSGRKIALITGGSEGIGFEISKQLGLKNFTVIIVARSESKISDAIVRLRGNAIDAYGRRMDVSDEWSVHAVAKWIEDDFGHLDVLINNAGVAPEMTNPKDISNLSIETLRTTHDTNFYGAFITTKQFLPLLKKSNSARIINQSSTLGSLSTLTDITSEYYDNSNLFAYNSSKSALNALTVAFAKNLRADGISVNSVCPGWVRTKMGGDIAPRDVEQGASIAVHLATMENPPTASFIDENGEIPW